MRKLGAELCCSVGVAALVGGVCSLVYGLLHVRTTHVPGSVLYAEDYCFIGSVLAAIGSGLITFGLLLLLRRRRDPIKSGREDLA